MTEFHDLPVKAARASVEGADLVWHCGVCNTVVADREGVLIVSPTAADERHEVVERARASVASGDPDGNGKLMSLGDLMRFPDEVPWVALHDGCAPESVDSDYWIAIERIRTVLALVRWTAHLWDKSWIDDTTWSDILQGVGEFASTDGS